MHWIFVLLHLFHRVNAPQGLHSIAQGQAAFGSEAQARRELAEAATLGRRTAHAELNPAGVPQVSRALCNPCRVETAGDEYSPGWRCAALRLRLPWALFYNTCGVDRHATSWLAISAAFLIVVVGLSRSAPAQVVKIGEDNDETPPTYKMTVSPAAEPQPALKYHFLILPVDQIKGNAATFYYKAMVNEGPDLWSWEGPLAEKVDAWRTTPLDQLPQKEIGERAYFIRDYSAWQDLQEASRCDQCEWEDMIREHGIATPLPQAQKMRNVARGIALRARTEVAVGKFADAISTLNIGYALSRHMSQAPTIVQNLIGIAIQGSTDEQTLELIAAVGSPNLYWALTDLASQPINMRYAFSYESRLWEFSLHEIQGLDRGTLSNEEALAIVEKLPQMVQPLRSRSGGPVIPDKMKAFVWGIQFYPRAKADLLRRGYGQERLDAMPMLQVVLLYRWKQYEEVRDNVFKWLMMPADEAWQCRDQSENRAKAAALNGEGEPFTLLLPAMYAALQAQMGAQRQTDILRAIEALRMHAARHGAWPDRLEDVTLVPVPTDPFTGKPFGYSVKDGVAILTVPPVAKGAYWGGIGNYELTLRK